MMRRALVGLLLALGVAAHADTATPRLGLVQPTVGSANWGGKLNNGVFAVVDSSAAAQFASNTFTSSNTFKAPVLLSGASVQLTGSGGYITGASSITASAFFGDGSHLTGISVSTSQITGTLQVANGGTGATTDSGARSNLSAAQSGGNQDIVSVSSLTKISSAYTATSSMTNTSAGGIVATSSITGAHYGDGSHLTGLTVSSCTVIPNTAFTNAAYGVALATVTITTRGNPVLVSLIGRASNTGAHTTNSGVMVDSAFTHEAAGKNLGGGFAPNAAVNEVSQNYIVSLAGLSAASHTFAVILKTNSGTSTFLNSATQYSQLCAREIP